MSSCMGNQIVGGCFKRSEIVLTGLGDGPIIARLLFQAPVRIHFAAGAPESKLAEPLPKLLDIRKFIAADIELHVSEPLQNFERLRDMLESPRDESEWGNVDIRLHCFIDAQGKRRIDGKVQASVLVTCQRCLQPMPLTLDSQFAVAAVWSDEDAEHLPKHLDAYIVGEGLQDVRPLIEDELIIGLPYVSYHELEDCAVEPYRTVESNDEDGVDAVQPEAKENPFKVLEQLKPSK